MELINLEKKVNDKYIHNYVLSYTNRVGGRKEYEIVSRNPDLSLNTLGNSNNAITIVGFCNDKMLISKEFRLSINRWIYNFPCGLIDKGETIEEAAKRELMEETGMEIETFIKILPPAFSAMGISDEKTTLIFAKIKGTPTSNLDFVDEEIEPKLVSKKEMQELLDKEEFAGKTQAIAYLWANDVHF